MKHIKAVQDKKKSAVYTKCLKEIMVAARSGSDPSLNARLRKAMTDARNQSVPKDNIERAVKKGAGELDDGGQLEELTYEGHGPGGVSILVDCVTDNRNRTQPELRKIFEKSGGSIAEKGAVSWGFDTKGLFLIARDKIEEEALMELALDAGAEDIETSDDGYQVTCAPSEFWNIQKVFEEKEIETELAEVAKVPTVKTEISDEINEKLEKLVDALEDHDDVQKVFTSAEG